MRHIFAIALLAAAVSLAGCTDSIGVTCPPGQTLCGQTCVYTTSDPANCGSCSNACTGDTVCIGGVCGCPKNQSVCSGKCAATSSDVANCGSCGNACPVPQVCSLSLCAGSCATGLTNCSRSCVDLQSDDANCGACGTACTSDQRCVAGVCSQVCPAGQKLCGTTCVNLTNDRANCGACGNACPTDYFCIFGECILGCPKPLTRCEPDGGASDGGSQCVDTRWDPLNCGGCGGADVNPSPSPLEVAFPHVCTVVEDDNHDPVCDNGSCGQSCKVGFTECIPVQRGDKRFWSEGAPSSTATLSYCAALGSDPCNCGACGFNCGGWFSNFSVDTEQCFNEGGEQLCCNDSCTDVQSPTSCGSACGALTDCSATANPDCCPDLMTAGVNGCVNEQTDVHNCGGCGLFGNDCANQDLTTPGCCGGGCIDLANDIANCGTCGNVCPAPQPSSAPTCCPVPSPAPGAPATACADTAFDTHNCGFCGHDCAVACGGPAPCFNGGCQCP